MSPTPVPGWRRGSRRREGKDLLGDEQFYFFRQAIWPLQVQVPRLQKIALNYLNLRNVLHHRRPGLDREHLFSASLLFQAPMSRLITDRFCFVNTMF